MQRTYIIAESGGTKTSWLVLINNDVVFQCETESFHIRNRSNWTTINLRQILDLVKGEAYLEFYGAGCSDERVCDEVRSFFSSHFHAVHVFPDTLAACRATLKSEAGYVAILGTGSVVIEYDGEQILSTRGGWGPVLGDEGGGYYFGKLLAQHYLSDKLSQVFASKLGERRSLIRSSLSDNSVAFLSNLAKESAEKELEGIHELNFQRFFERYIQGLDKQSVLHVVGSYGFHRKEQLKKVLEAQGWTLGTIIEKPIIKLAQFYVGK